MTTWIHSLADVRRRFAEIDADLRHVLLTVDAEVRGIPTAFECDPIEGFIRWGLPHDHYWRQLPGETTPRPVLVQSIEHGHPFVWLHAFYGVSAYQELERLAYGAFRCIADAPIEVYAAIAEQTGVPLDSPKIHVQTPEHWWMRAVHGIARRSHPHSDLQPKRFAAVSDPSPSVDWQAQRKALSSGRPDVADFSYSLPSGNVFECSVWAIDVILREVGSKVATQRTQPTELRMDDGSQAADSVPAPTSIESPLLKVDDPRLPLGPRPAHIKHGVAKELVSGNLY
jgi:hypothetical protein